MRKFVEILESYKDFNFMEEYNKRIANSKRKEYSRGGLMYTLGIYGPSLLYKYIITNCTYGKKIKKPRKALDYTYYFDKDDKLILIDKENYTVSFYFYDSNVTKILTFCSFKKSPRISVYYECTYDECSRIKYYLEVDSVFNTEQYYSYDSPNTIEVKEIITSNSNKKPPRIDNYSIPVSFFEPKDYKLKDINVPEMLESSIKNRISESTKTNIRSINFILFEDKIDIDFNNDVDAIDDELLDYSNWKQDSVNLFSDEYSKKFEYWVLKTNNSSYGLIENKRFINILCKVINNLRSNHLINENVLIMIHNLEYYDEVINIAKKVNSKENIERILKWYR